MTAFKHLNPDNPMLNTISDQLFTNRLRLEKLNL